MRTIQRDTQDRTDSRRLTRADAIPHPSTQHTPLGIDNEGYHHIWTQDDRVVVLNHEGIDHVEDLSEHDNQDVSDWLTYVLNERGWTYVQYLTAEYVYGDA